MRKTIGLFAFLLLTGFTLMMGSDVTQAAGNSATNMSSPSMQGNRSYDDSSMRTNGYNASSVGGNYRTNAVNDNDNDFDWGWLGLLGLIGLAGLRHRNPERHS